MPVNSVQFGNLYKVNNIKYVQNNSAQGIAQGVNSVKDRELHPEVCSTDLGVTPYANKLDILC